MAARYRIGDAFDQPRRAGPRFADRLTSRLGAGPGIPGWLSSPTGSRPDRVALTIARRFRRVNP